MRCKIFLKTHVRYIFKNLILEFKDDSKGLENIEKTSYEVNRLLTDSVR